MAASVTTATEPPRLNVLLYSGAGATPTPLLHTRHTLHALLGGRYAIIPVDDRALAADPWESSTALLVIPGGRDLPITERLGAAGARRVREFVRNGGRYWGLCSGAYYAARGVEFEPEDPALRVVGKRDLALFPGIARGAVFPGFKYDSEDGARAAGVQLEDGTPIESFACYFNGGCFFDLESMTAAPESTDGNGSGGGVSTVRVLARYSDPLPAHWSPSASPSFDGAPEGTQSSLPPPAIVQCTLGTGTAVLSGVHVEYAPDLLAGHPDQALVAALRASDPARRAVLEWLLGSILGLTIALPMAPWDPAATATGRFSPTSPTTPMNIAPTHPHAPMYAVSLDAQNALLPLLQQQASGDRTPFAAWQIADAHDAFTVYPGGAPPPSHRDAPRVEPWTPERPPPVLISSAVAADSYAWPLHVLALPSHQPDAEHAFFALPAYAEHLAARRAQFRHVRWAAGSSVVYSRVVTSTQTLVDGNPRLAAALPSGTVVVGYHQTAGRGRGANAWISPPGCLQFSVVMRTALRPTAASPTIPYIPPAATVQVQYLMALAVSRAACLRPANVRVKWPNDIYASSPASTGAATPPFVKVGGILVTSSLADNVFTLVIGCGINMANAAPTTSMNAVLASVGAPAVTLEQVLADILVELDLVWGRFIGSGGSMHADGLVDEYYKVWLHSGQEVEVAEDIMTVGGGKKLSGQQGAKRMRISGIDENGFLVGADTTTMARVVVQPDGNSFDMMRGLIRRKEAM
ncbi:biotin-protein ligase [Blastocladiella britannica]|nr:biotin-protein ligase [Blastocladiella britannica]